MSCNPITFSGCEIAGTTFEGRTLKVSGVEISGAKFTAKILSNFGRLLKEIPGVIRGDTAYFSFTEIESFGREKYRIEYWAEIPEVGTEVIAVEDFKIVGAGENGCGCGKSEISANVVFEKKEIAVSIDKSIVNFGDGAGVNLDGYLKAETAETTYQKKGDYALKSEIPTIPAPPNLSIYATKIALNDEIAEREKIGATVAANAQNIQLNSLAVSQISQNVAINSASVQNISQAVSSKAEKSYVDGKFSEIIGSAPEALNTLYELASELQKDNGLIEAVTISVGKKADITWVNDTFQPKGNYLQPAALLPYSTTTENANLYAPKNHAHSFNDLTDKPSIFSGKYSDLSGIPASFAPSAHTHDAVLNQNGSGSLKFWTGTQAQYDAISAKDNSVIYLIS